jgi:hypothetical protein
MADRTNDHDRAVRPLAVYNGAMTGMRKNGDDGGSYAVWRARLIINLREKRLFSIVTGDNDEDESEEEDNQPSARRRQARAAHIMTSALGTGPFSVCSGCHYRPCGYSPHPGYKVPRHRHFVRHVGRQRVRHQEVPAWPARVNAYRRVRRFVHAPGHDWARYF